MVSLHFRTLRVLLRLMHANLLHRRKTKHRGLIQVFAVPMAQALSKQLQAPLLQVGPTPRRLALRQSMEDIFSSFDTDGSTIWMATLKEVFGTKSRYGGST